MSDKVMCRMGDGERVWLPAEKIKDDILKGTRDAAERANINELTADECEQLFDILADTAKVVSVAPGEEVVVTDDAVSMLFYADQENSGQGIPMSRTQALLAYERACAADTISMGHTDYSYKQVKPIINYETQEYYTASQLTTAPFFYGSQPNMGLYFQPDGPYPNPAELLPLGTYIRGA
jgi:dimethylamine--corrinoid protein Co-methyltransferase